ncbi:MAG: 4Fe-4S binding protein [Deltaproteobacteria bacterium]|nr:4Fe-4S binding protein [Deltaproteobacteria bacterium]
MSIKSSTWLTLRRVSQVVFLALFLLLFLKAEFVEQEILAWPVDLFFRFDPLILASHLVSFSPLVGGLFWALVLVALTFILGRFFCGWVCPLGTTLDGARRLLFSPRPDRGVAARWRRAKYYLLLALLVSTLLSVNLIGLFDPLSLLYRSLAIVLYPAFGYGVEHAALVLYRLGPPATYVSEPVYQFFKAALLPFRSLLYLMPFLTLALFALVVAAERLDRRFWCRALCPLGALYGLLARFSLLRRRPTALCPDCGDCLETCKMDAFAPGQPSRHQNAECQLCLSCLARCEKDNRVTFTMRSKAPRAPLDLGRRQVISAVAAGAAMVPLMRLGSLARRPDEYLIRPPGAQDEAEFLARCVRCGQCLKVCLTNGLQPVLWEAGLEGLYTPRLIPRMGYCNYSCTLCSQVCPTGAIPRLELKVKQTTNLGVAFFDRSRCIPYTEGADCLVCEEHCPTSPKAIVFNEQEVSNFQGERVKVKLPVVNPDRCNGCGHCENVCPVGGESAIRVKRSLRVEI